jgi:hypothetical protein
MTCLRRPATSSTTNSDRSFAAGTFRLSIHFFILGDVMLPVLLAGTFVFGFVAGFVCCWAAANHTVSSLKRDLEALRFAVGGD